MQEHSTEAMVLKKKKIISRDINFFLIFMIVPLRKYAILFYFTVSVDGIHRRVHSEPCETSKNEHFANIIRAF